MMSKSLAVDALLTAVDGGHVAVFGESLDESEKVYAQLLWDYPEMSVVAERVDAISRICLTFPGGGTLSFLSLASNPDRLRGWSLDRCYVPIGTSPEFVSMHLRPCLATSKDGTMAGY